MNRDQKRRLVQQSIIVFALPVFVLLSAQRRETVVIVEQPDTGVQQQSSEAAFEGMEIGCTSSERGPLRILNFIARAAKSTRRRDEGVSHCPVRVQIVHVCISQATLGV